MRRPGLAASFTAALETWAASPPIRTGARASEPSEARLVWLRFSQQCHLLKGKENWVSCWEVPPERTDNAQLATRGTGDPTAAARGLCSDWRADVSYQKEIGIMN